MSSQTNKTALKQMEKTEFLVTSAKTQKPTVNDRLSTIGPDIFGEGSGEAPPAPDWNQLQEWGIAALESSVEEMRQTGRAYRKSKVRLGKARQDRNDKLDLVAAAHRTLRKSFAGTYGARSLPLLGLDAEPARALKASREQMGEVVVRMRDPQLASALPEPLAGQRPLELESVADARAAEIGDLEARMGEVDVLVKETDEALVVRNQALARNRRVYSNVGRLLEGVYRLAGLDELADRIRATQRAARKKTDGEPEEGSATTEPETDQSETAREGGEAA